MPFAKSAATYQEIINKIILLSVFMISQTIWSPNMAQATNQETIDRKRKIVMMLNIAAKEFEEGVVDGEIVVPPEYEESKVFSISEQYHQLLTIIYLNINNHLQFLKLFCQPQPF